MSTVAGILSPGDMKYLTYIADKILKDRVLWIAAPPFLDENGKHKRAEAWREALEEWKESHPGLRFYWSCSSCNQAALEATPGTIVTAESRGKQCSLCAKMCTLVRYSFDLKTNEPKDAIPLLIWIAPEYQVEKRALDLQIVFRSRLSSSSSSSSLTSATKGSKIAQIRLEKQKETEDKARRLLRAMQDAELTEEEKEKLMKQVRAAKEEKERSRVAAAQILKKAGQRSIFEMLPTVERTGSRGKGGILLGDFNPSPIATPARDPLKLRFAKGGKK